MILRNKKQKWNVSAEHPLCPMIYLYFINFKINKNLIGP